MQRALKVAAFGGVVLGVSLAAGPIYTAVAMLRAFDRSGSEGVAAEELAADVEQAISVSVVCLPFAVLGLCLVVGGLVAHSIGRGRHDPIDRSRDDQ